ncbi:ABC transporter ATP-binding protein [Celeribacter persicus]|uniref:Uncharacterized protein n=1 Tax=Celeribacter persicus TaxID=1651082 RepID=A0A2T5H9V5_9RHOB|nr:ABC transporter ATP-binding protein [Celeribacter persicus]PTQ68322.1 hypothetical protein C8N42_11534 [Celeribacter persicus]
MTFVGAFFLMLNLHPQLVLIAAVIETYPRAIAGFRSYLELLSTERDVTDGPDAHPAPVFRGDAVRERFLHRRSGTDWSSRIVWRPFAMPTRSSSWMQDVYICPTRWRIF